jgi:hypothetical protein
VPPKPGQEGDDMSLTNVDGSVTDTVDQERWRMMEVRMRSMEERATREEDDEGATMVSGATGVTLPPNERILKENLRKFVAAKVFPNWKHMLEKDKLGSCVVSAVAKSHMTVPPGFDGRKLAERCGGTARACLDGCKANAQTAARKRHLGE